MWLMMLKQAMGVPDGAHGAFTVNGMDAVTIRPVNQPGQARQQMLLHDTLLYMLHGDSLLHGLCHCCALLATCPVFQPKQVLQHTSTAAGGCHCPSRRPAQTGAACRCKTCIAPCRAMQNSPRLMQLSEHV